MTVGIFSGLFWAIETILIGKVMGMNGLQTFLIAPFICTFFHDLFSAAWISVHNGVCGNLKEFKEFLHTSNARYVSLAAIIGGPVGMSGYMMTIHYLGSSIGAVVSAVFPAVGTVLAVVFLKEKMKWYQWIFLFLTLIGVYGINFTSDIAIVNVWMGLLGAILCSFGWGIEAVILAKNLKETNHKDECFLQVRQMTSAFVYGIIIIPLMIKMNLTIKFFNLKILLMVGIASLFATLSYIFYYKSISKIGASKAMALNISYVAWAMILSALVFKEYSHLTPFVIVCSCLVFVCGILTTFDFKKINV